MSDTKVKVYRKFPRPGRAVIALISILLLASFFRFYNITEKGIFFHDEAVYLLEGRFLNNSAHFVIDVLRHNKTLDQAVASIQGFPLETAKPTHAIFLFIVSFFTGTKDYMAFVLSAIFGLLSIFAVYRLGILMFNERVALISTLMMAVSAFHVYYSRSGFPEMDASFFTILAVCFYYSYREREGQDPDLRKLFTTGILIGTAFTIHYRYALLPIVFWLLELIHYCSKRCLLSFKGKLRRFAIFSIGMALPLLIIEAVFRLVKHTISDIYPIYSYFDQLHLRHHYFSPVFDPTYFDLLTYPRYLLELNGLLTVILLTIGTIYIGLRLFSTVSLSYLILFIFVPLQFFYYGLCSTGWSHPPRAIANALPFVALIAAIAIDYLFTLIEATGINKSIQKGIKVFLLGIIIIIGCQRSFEISVLKSEYSYAVEQTSEYIITKNIPPINFMFPASRIQLYPIWRFYAEEFSKKAGVPVERLLLRKPEIPADHFVLLYPSIYHEAGESLELSGLDRIRNQYKPIFTGRIDWTEKKVLMLEAEYLRLDEPHMMSRFDEGAFSFAHQLSVYYVPKDERFHL